ncbi:MAG: hypothetical protein PUP46_10475, partial [Endozoicomonas sp. (ex Botrylloides leachii)]|nr:hypothetical protein [Endozoicomonas sp. (ex Botrylloides leachii)]
GFSELGNAELEQLEPYRDAMRTTQLMSIILRMNCCDVDEQTQNAWFTAFNRRKKDPLGLSLI